MQKLNGQGQLTIPYILIQTHQHFGSYQGSSLFLGQQHKQLTHIDKQKLGNTHNTPTHPLPPQVVFDLNLILPYSRDCSITRGPDSRTSATSRFHLYSWSALPPSQPGIVAASMPGANPFPYLPLNRGHACQQDYQKGGDKDAKRVVQSLIC